MPRYFDDDLPRVNADKIKPMVKMWGGSYKMNKYDCIDFIVAGLKDPQKVQEAVASLQPWERNALALVKLMGGVIPYRSLKVGILASGLHPQRTYGYRDDFIEALLHRGLILATDFQSPGYISESYSRGGALYSDERLLAQVRFPEYLPLEILPTTAQGKVHFRRPSAMALDVMGMLQAIDNMGGVKFTQAGTVHVNDEAKLRKALRWGEKSMDVDGFLFPNPVQAWLGAFSHSDLLKKTDNGQLVLVESPERFARRPFGEQVRLLMEGLLRSPTWWEAPQKNAYLDSYGGGRRQGRLALTLALSALPLNSDAFFSLKDFDQSFYNRIGEDFALDYPPQRPYYFRSTTSEQSRQELAAWQEKTRADWLKQEYPWLISAFTTWLYFLGLVELAVDNGQPVGFRLTEIGRATFHPELNSASPPETDLQASSQPGWVVQPNFDIIAYLDRVSAPQLAFLERHAERMQSHQHTAHYRLTRESVYRGLESGTTLDDLLDKLQTGSQVELPQNISVELCEWASLHERIILRRSAQLVEFPSAQALRDGLAQGLMGSVVAERFLLLASQPVPQSFGLTRINYAQPLPKDLAITEIGAVHLKRGSHDLVTAAQLSQWALQTADFEWQLTAESVSTALQSGRKITELLTLLNVRLKHSLPALLELALRSWAGAAYPVELESVIVLRCPQEHIFRPMLNSPLITACLHGYNEPDLLFVNPEQFETLRQHLRWLGCKISDQLQITPFRSPNRV